MIYKRRLFDAINPHIEDKEIIVLTGMRRVGKTTLYRMIFDQIKSQNKVFLDLENPLEQKFFEEIDYNNILFNLKRFNINPTLKIYLFLDEVQAMPSVIKAVKYLHDHHNIKFFLTGSSSFYFKNLFPESLAGRKFVFELYPLDFQEFLIFQNAPLDFHPSFSEKIRNKNVIAYEKKKKYYDEYLDYGGFPEVVLSESIALKKLRLTDIFKSYFEKDVKLMADFREIKAFRDLILLLLQRTGAKIDISKLASEIGVSRETVYSFISFLENTYFINLITPLSRSVDREVSGSRKVYICDNGFLNYFAKVSEGSSFENAVFLNLRKYGKINYYQKRSGGEIDFILDSKKAFEVKTKPTPSDFNALKKNSLSLGIKEQYIITRQFDQSEYTVPAFSL